MRIVQQGGGIKANLQLTVLREIEGNPASMNFAKGRCTFKTVLGDFHFDEADRDALGALFRSYADVVDSGVRKDGS